MCRVRPGTLGLGPAPVPSMTSLVWFPFLRAARTSLPVVLLAVVWAASELRPITAASLPAGQETPPKALLQLRRRQLSLMTSGPWLPPPAPASSIDPTLPKTEPNAGRPNRPHSWESHALAAG